MGRKSDVVTYSLLDIPDALVLTNSEPFNALNYDNIGIQISWEPTVEGAINILVSNEDEFVVANNNWSYLEFGTNIELPSITSGNLFININQFPFKWLVLQFDAFVPTSTGALQAKLTAKMLE